MMIYPGDSPDKLDSSEKTEYEYLAEVFFQQIDRLMSGARYNFSVVGTEQLSIAMYYDRSLIISAPVDSRSKQEGCITETIYGDNREVVFEFTERDIERSVDEIDVYMYTYATVAKNRGTLKMGERIYDSGALLAVSEECDSPFLDAGDLECIIMVLATINPSWVEVVEPYDRLSDEYLN